MFAGFRTFWKVSHSLGTDRWEKEHTSRLSKWTQASQDILGGDMGYSLIFKEMACPKHLSKLHVCLVGSLAVGFSTQIYIW